MVLARAGEGGGGTRPGLRTFHLPACLGKLGNLAWVTWKEIGQGRMMYCRDLGEEKD